MPDLSRKEIDLIEQLALAQDSPSQRQLARRTEISIGLLNTLLHRLMNRGYVKAKSLNRRKIQYLLTPKGLRHTLKRTYRLAEKTIQSYHQLENRILSIVQEHVADGYSRFVLVGDGEIADLVRKIMNTHYPDQVRLFTTPPGDHGNHVVINVRDSLYSKGGKTINVLGLLKKYERNKTFFLQD